MTHTEIINRLHAPTGVSGYRWWSHKTTDLEQENYPKITIVTPTLNQGKYIEETILSVLSQGYPNLEYIIIDGGSNDGTLEILKKYEHQLTYWISEKDTGQSSAINKALSIATGELFNWLNSDDLLAPGALEIIAKNYNGKNVDVIKGNYLSFSERGWGKQVKSKNFQTLEQTAIYSAICQPATFYKTDILRKFGSINENLHYCMDLEIWYKYLFRYGKDKIKLIDHVLAFFRLHEQSKSIQLLERLKQERLGIRVALLNHIYPNYFKRHHLSAMLKKDFNIDYDDRLEIKIPVNKEKLAAYILELIVDDFHREISIPTFWSLLYSSFQLSPFQRRWRFYLSPIRAFKRIFLPI